MADILNRKSVVRKEDDEDLPRKQRSEKNIASKQTG